MLDRLKEYSIGSCGSPATVWASNVYHINTLQLPPNLV